MSSLNVHDINGISTYGNEVRIPSGSSLNVAGELDAGTVDVASRLYLPVWTNSTRPSNPAIGTMGYNNDADDRKRMEFYNGTEWVNIDKTEIMSHMLSHTNHYLFTHIFVKRNRRFHTKMQRFLLFQRVL